MNPTEMSLLSALSDTNAEYTIVGGVAVIAHGYLRNTRDLDVFFRPTLENAQAVYEALTKLNLPLQNMDAGDLLNDEGHYRFAAEEQYVDILSSIGDMSFDQVWSNRIETEIDGIKVIFISKRDLIENKIATGRSRDLTDVDELTHIQSKLE